MQESDFTRDLPEAAGEAPTVPQDNERADQAADGAGAPVEQPAEIESAPEERTQSDPSRLRARQILENQERRRSFDYVDDQIKKISAIDPSIRTAEDLFKSQTFLEFDRLARNSELSMVEAYKAANYERLSQMRAADNAYSKGHLKKSPQGGYLSGATVPQEVYTIYRRNLKGWTDKQIREHYERYLNDN